MKAKKPIISLKKAGDTSKMPKAQLKQGIKHEMEHTKSKSVAKRIASQHAQKDYYPKLDVMEEVSLKDMKKIKSRRK